MLIPTRTYAPRPKDSPQGISTRFGISQASLYLNNPEIYGNRLPERLALKFSPHPYGAAATNGYFYRGCTASRLKETLPYLTYVTFAAGRITDGGCERLFDTHEAVKMCKDSGSVPLVKLFDKRERTKDGTKAIEEVISFAKNGNFCGITLDLSDFPTDKNTAEFLLELRRAMIGCDLILITEVTDKKEIPFVDYSDGSDLLTGVGISAKELRGVLSDFSDNSESIKTFVELPVFARCSDELIPIEEVISDARVTKARIETDKETLISSFEHKRKGRIEYPSLSYLKAVLDMVNEYGFMGVSFDVMRVPSVYLHTVSSLFKIYSSAGGM